MPQDAQCRRQGLCLLQPRRSRKERPRRHFQTALHDEGSAREPAAQRGRQLGQEGRHPGRRQLAERQGRGRLRDRLPPGARADAGLHRRSGRCRSRGDARRDGVARRRSGEDQPAGAGRSRHRPLGDRRRIRHADGLRPQCGEGIRAQRRALPLPEMGPAGVQELPRRAARHRHLPPGQPRISRPDRLDEGRGRRDRSPIPTPASAPTATPP